MNPIKLAQQLADEGGFSVSEAGTKPHSGYMVSRAGTERVVPGLAQPEDIAAFHQANVDRLSHPGYYMGGWQDEGKSYLDVSQRFPTAESSQVQGAVHHQLATFDVGHRAYPKVDPILPFNEHDTANLDIADVPHPQLRARGQVFGEQARRKSTRQPFMQQQQFGF